MHVKVVGIGAGNPEHITMQAIAALNSASVLFFSDKGDSKSELAAIRRDICERYLERDKKLVAFTPPRRDLSIASYETGVAHWHQNLAETYDTLLRDHLEPNGTGAFMVWGDPGLYDSTIRILDQVIGAGMALTYEVIPGITSIQALTAAHGIALNRIGAPVHVTTGRRLQEMGLNADSVIMLDGVQAFASLADDAEIFWGAYLGTPDEILIAGKLSAVRDEIRTTRETARAHHGWIMDIYLLRVPEPSP